jgi:YegS/Rv2252/BmrU family lipid kinase
MDSYFIRNTNDTNIEGPSMKKFCVIVNPVSGRGRGEMSVPMIERHLNELSLEYSLFRTERAWHAAELAKRAALDGADAVVAAGGDGTANEVLNGLMHAKASGADRTALAVLCVGRGNDFAYGMGIPKDLRDGCMALAGNFRRRIDVGMVTGGLYPQGRFFGNGVGIGFDAVVGFEALKMKRLKGFASYAAAAIKTISLYDKAPVVRIECDGESWTQPSLMVSLMNGRRMGGGFLMAPEGNPGDGSLNYCIAGQVGKRRIIPLILRFMKGTQFSHPAIRAGLFMRMRVTALEGALPAHADGETLCVDGTDLLIEILPSQLDLVVPGTAVH